MPDEARGRRPARSSVRSADRRCSTSRTLRAAVATARPSELSTRRRRESGGIPSLARRKRWDERAGWAASSATVHRIRSRIAFKELILKCKQTLAKASGNLPTLTLQPLLNHVCRGPLIPVHFVVESAHLFGRD